MDAIAALPLGSSSQELQEQLRLVLDAAGESWHTSAAAGGGTAAPSESELASPAVARWQQRAAAACEEAAAAVLKLRDVPSGLLQAPLQMLGLGFIGGAPLKVCWGAQCRGQI